MTTRLSPSPHPLDDAPPPRKNAGSRDSPSKSSNKPYKKYVLRALVVLLCLGAFAFGGLAAYMSILSEDLPNLDKLTSYSPPQTNEVYDSNNQLVARFATERRTVVPIDKIPKHVIYAFLAAEDSDFYEHGGVDYLSVFVSVLNEVKVKLIGGRRRGGSTITQQTAKTFFLNPEQTLRRKLKELLLARKIEETLSKDDILYLYLNQIYFGNGAYGIEEAARTYFGKSIHEVSLNEAAILASIPKHPNRINPINDPARVRTRRQYVLEQMVAHNFVAQEYANQALQEPILAVVKNPPYLNVAPYYTEYVRQELLNKLGGTGTPSDDPKREPSPAERELQQGGFIVTTAMDARLQKIANESLQNALREVDKRQGWRGPVLRAEGTDRIHLLQALAVDKQARFNTTELPDLKKDDFVTGRPIWDLSNVDMDDLKKVVQKASNAPANPANNTNPANPANTANNADHSDDTWDDVIDKIRTVNLTSEGVYVGALVKAVSAKQATLDLGSTEVTVPLSDMAWARPFSPAKATSAPKAVSEVLTEGDIALVRVYLATPTPAKKDKPAATVTATIQTTLRASLEQEPQVEGALVSADPQTRRILAMVGGYNFTRSSFNRATQAKRQPGSSFKPFIYAMGIETRKFTAFGEYNSDEPPSFIQDTAYTDCNWKLRNAGGEYGGDRTTRNCLTHSVNVCSARILDAVGTAPIFNFANQVGLNIEEKYRKGRGSGEDLGVECNPLALGAAEVTPLNLVAAYTIFPTNGLYAPPVTILSIQRRGKPLPSGAILSPPPAPISVLSPEAAYVTTDLMKSVVQDGTARRAKELGRPVAGKTGTTNDARSVWFVGFTPNLVAGVYVGFDNNDPLGGESGGKAALPAWLSFMKEATKNLPAVDFTQPSNVIRVEIDAKTGLLPLDDDGIDGIDSNTDGLDPNVVNAGNQNPKNTGPAGPAGTQSNAATYSEVFIKGTEPDLTVASKPPPTDL